MASDELTVPMTHVPIFKRLKAEQINALVDASERAMFRRGQPIIRAGEPGDAAFLVLKGEAIAFHKAVPEDNGKTLPEGTFLGELAMLTEIEYSTTVIAKSDVRALKFSRAMIEVLMRKDPELAAHFVETLRMRMMGYAAKLREIDRDLAREVKMPKMPKLEKAG